MTGTSWAETIKEYEYSRRYAEPPVRDTAPLPSGRALYLTRAQLAEQELLFNPVLGSFRDEAAERQFRAVEEKQLLTLLNRAKDVQNLRESHYDVVNHKFRLPSTEASTALDKISGSSTQRKPQHRADFDIVSNLPLDPEASSRVEERSIPRRNVPAATLKDYNVISNRYLSDHDVKTARDTQLTSLEATIKFRKKNVFDPIQQVFLDNRHEDRHRTCDLARDVEVLQRGEVKQPMSCIARESSYYDAIQHTVLDGQMLRKLDDTKWARKAGYRTKYEFEKQKRREELVMEDGALANLHESIAHERFIETTSRGHDIITNERYGFGPEEKPLHLPFTHPRPTPWELALKDHDEGSTCHATSSSSKVCRGGGGGGEKGSCLSARGRGTVALAPQLDASSRWKSSTPRVSSREIAAKLALALPSHRTDESVSRRSDRGSNNPATTLSKTQLELPAALCAAGVLLKPPLAPAIPGNAVGPVYSGQASNAAK